MRKVNKRSVAQAMREMSKSPALSENWPALKLTGFFTRSGNLLCQGINLKYQAIKPCRGEFSIRLVCRCLKVSLSGHNDWEGRPASARAVYTQRLLERIREVHSDSQGAIGAPRMHELLTDEGETASKNCIARMMAAYGLQVWTRNKNRGQRGKPGLPRPGVENRLERDLVAPEPETKWASDIIKKN